MKKITVILVLMCTILGCACAHEVKGSFGALKGENRVRLEVSFDGASIYDMNEETFAEFETDWEEDKPEVVGRFVTAAQSVLCGKLMLVNNKNCADYTIRVQVLDLSASGLCLCDVFLLDNEGNELGRIENISGEGIGGTKLRRIKNSATDTGFHIGKQIKKAIRRA